MSKPKPSTNYVFTINNWTSNDVDKLFKLSKVPFVKCIMYGKEVGKKGGTPHLQGFVVFGSKKSLKQVKLLHATAHWECMKGRVDHNVTYCSKDGDVTVLGVVPVSNKSKGKKEKDRWVEINALTKAGKLAEVEALYPREWNVGYRRLIFIAEQHAPTPPTIDKLEHRWYYGGTGTGKSRSAREEFPKAYIKLLNKWWDGYKGEETVIIDDLDKYDIKLGGFLKRWSDHYPYPAEYKGGVKVIRPKRIIVTSNYTPEEIWEDPKTTGPINRRFARKHFTSLFNK